MLEIVISDISNCIQAYNVENQFTEISRIDTGACKIEIINFLVKSWKFAISPNSNLIATGSNSVMLYDIDSGEKINEIGNDNKYIYSIAYINEITLAIGNINGGVYIINTDTKKRVNNLKGKLSYKNSDSCMTIRSILHDSINERLICASDDLHINIYNTKDFKIMFPLVGHKNEISNIQYNPIKNVYATSSFDGTIKIWDAKLNSKNNLLQTLNLNSISSNYLNGILQSKISKDEFNIIWDICFSPDGKYLMAGSENGLHIFSC